MKNKRSTINKGRKNGSSVENKIDTALKSSFLGILFTAGVSLAIIFASTAAALMTDDPTALVAPIGYISTFVSSFLGGVICYKLNKNAPYLTSAITGCAFVLLSMLFSFSLPHSLASGMKIFVRLGLHTISYTLFPLGALVGVKASKPKRKIKHHKRK